MNQINSFSILLIFDMLMIILMIIPSNLYNFNPITLSLILICYVILLAFKLSLKFNIYWYSYILFLIMIGGMMILFMYFTSLMNNELFFFKMEFNFYQFLKFIMIFFIMFFMIKELYMFNYLMNMSFFELNNFIHIFSKNNLFKNLMMDYILKINLFMVMYLFLTMMISVLICNKVMIPLRQMMMK